MKDSVGMGLAVRNMGLASRKKMVYDEEDVRSGRSVDSLLLDYHHLLRLRYASLLPYENDRFTGFYDQLVLEKIGFQVPLFFGQKRCNYCGVNPRIVRRLVWIFRKKFGAR